jgi:protein subunit release factor B
MKLNNLFAMFFIVMCSISTGATGQNVYRCGNAYSQKPCTDSVVVDVQDARTPAQKAESDALIKRDSASANAMEKARLKEEAQQRADNAKLAAAAKIASAKSKNEPTDNVTSSHKAITKKKSAHKKKEPDYFSTRAAPAKPKQAVSASK